MTNPLHELEALGQSVWLDDINREYLYSGLFARLINEDGLGGATGNPTIFEHAIDSGHAYDAQMRPLLAQGLPAQQIYEQLAIRDVQQVADLLRPVYERTDGQDGFVSIEVSPFLATDTQGTLVEVRRFWQTIARPNLMVKIPATPEGIPAIRQALFEGININITLLFGLPNYRQVALAYLEALEERLARGEPINRLASVASFFVSRVDVLVDHLLDEHLRTAVAPEQRARLESLRGTVALANARLAYQEFRRLFGGPRFAALKAQGARVQRPLWASTSTKHPGERDVRYVEELIGPETVNTMPLFTLEAFRDHGCARLSVEEHVSAAHASLAILAAAGLDYDQITRQLQEEGIQHFVASFQTLFARIESERTARGAGK